MALRVFDGTILPETPNDQGGQSTPAPPVRIDLHNPAAIRREMAAVYRDMRAGRIETQDGTRLVYVLDALRKGFETEALQERLERVELVLKQRPKE